MGLKSELWGPLEEKRNDGTRVCPVGEEGAMALSGIQPQGVRALESKKLVTEMLRDGVRKSQEAGSGTGTDSVTFQGRIESLETQRLVTERVLSRVESESVSGLSPVQAQQLFQTSGQAQFQSDLASQQGEAATPEAMAGQIVQGITGYIFKAFQANNPDLDRTKLEGFQQQALKGVDQGLGDARDILTGLQVLNSDLADSLDKTGQLARQQLASFFSKTAETLQDQTSGVVAAV